jgi:rhomboid protease GluP
MALLLVAGLIFYCTTPEERLRVSRKLEGFLRSSGGIIGMVRFRTDDPAYAALCARRPWPLATCMLAAVNLGVLVAMLRGPTPLDLSDTLVAWGGSFGPLTTGAERWRIFTAIFVHRGALHLLINIAALVQLGRVLERMVGPFTFATIFIASGALASIMATAAAPMSVYVGAAGAVCGLYGLLLATLLRGMLPGTVLHVSVPILKALAPMAAIFAAYCVVTGEPLISAKAGLCAGFVGGIVLTRSVPDPRARLRRFAVLGAATAIIVLMSAMGLRAVADIRPAIAEVIAHEERAATDYDAAVLRFRKGGITTRDLAQTIDTAITPRLLRDSERFKTLADVPDEHALVVAETQEYLRLRHVSWRTRSDALHKGDLRKLRQADKEEHAALEAFARLRAAAPR